MLQEYTKFWDAYVAASIAIHKDLLAVAVVINSVYERAYPNHPCFPKFSFLRLLVSVWRHEVFEPLEAALLAQTFSYIERHREKIKKYGQMLRTKRKRVNESQLASAEVEGFLRSNSSQEEIENSLRFRKDVLLRRFVASVLDLSLNELSVHYLEHCKLDLEGTAYKRFEDKLLAESRDFNQKCAESFPLEIMVELMRYDEAWRTEVVSTQTQYLLSLKALKVVNGGFAQKLRKKYEDAKKVVRGDFVAPLLWGVRSAEAEALKKEVAGLGEAADGPLFAFIHYLHQTGAANLITRIVKY